MPCATTTEPPAVSVTPGFDDDRLASVTFASVGVPSSSVSLDSTLATATPPVRGAEPLSAPALIGRRTTVTVTAPGAQLPSVVRSQIW